ncbi:MAG TPA: DUF3105 domain-containing protein [Candidatus Limnocylindria bacterium]|nr:DUF3105 domain-containing protein [Candidatus Limnocylindria bacterium]
MAKRRRTQQIQRRTTRASEEALNRPLGAGRRFDPRLLIVGGVLVVGVIIVAVALVAFSGPNPNAGIAQADRGGGHVPPGTTCRASDEPCGPDPYSSIPATSGPHWDPSGIANWGVYTTPQNETQLIHNLEHGGIVVWYQPGQIDEAALTQLTDWATSQLRSARFKVIVSPWSGPDFGHPIAATAWNFLLYQDALDVGQLQGFMDARYGRSPEPNGGPGQPAV